MYYTSLKLGLCLSLTLSTYFFCDFLHLQELYVSTSKMLNKCRTRYGNQINNSDAYCEHIAFKTVRWHFSFQTYIYSTFAKLTRKYFDIGRSQSNTDVHLLASLISKNCRIILYG